jgi:hypothetical protein
LLHKLWYVLCYSSIFFSSSSWFEQAAAIAGVSRKGRGVYIKYTLHSSSCEFFTTLGESSESLEDDRKFKRAFQKQRQEEEEIERRVPLLRPW